MRSRRPHSEPDTLFGERPSCGAPSPALPAFRVLLLLASAALALAGCGGASVQSSGALGSGNGTATLNWTPVTQNTNGTELTDLAGYRVYYGTSPEDLSAVVVLDDPTQTSYLVGSLAAGTWYFAVAAYTTTGTVGELSNIAAKTVGSGSVQ
jgi:hypothetical protein